MGSKNQKTKGEITPPQCCEKHQLLLLHFTGPVMKVADKDTAQLCFHLKVTLHVSLKPRKWRATQSKVV